MNKSNKNNVNTSYNIQWSAQVTLCTKQISYSRTTNQKLLHRHTLFSKILVCHYISFIYKINFFIYNKLFQKLGNSTYKKKLCNPVTLKLLNDTDYKSLQLKLEFSSKIKEIITPVFDYILRNTELVIFKPSFFFLFSFHLQSTSLLHFYMTKLKLLLQSPCSKVNTRMDELE